MVCRQIVEDERVKCREGCAKQELDDLHCCESLLEGLWHSYGKYAQCVVGILQYGHTCQWESLSTIQDRITYHERVNERVDEDEHPDRR